MRATRPSPPSRLAAGGAGADERRPKKRVIPPELRGSAAADETDEADESGGGGGGAGGAEVAPGGSAAGGGGAGAAIDARVLKSSSMASAGAAFGLDEAEPIAAAAVTTYRAGGRAHLGGALRSTGVRGGARRGLRQQRFAHVATCEAESGSMRTPERVYHSCTLVFTGTGKVSAKTGEMLHF